MYILPIDELEKVLTSAQTAFPRETSGLLLRQKFGRFTLLSLTVTSSAENTVLSFRIRDAAINEIAESLKGASTTIGGCFHSHIIGPARPSSRDCAATKEPGDLWLIYSVGFRDLNLFRWSGMTFQKARLLIVPSLKEWDIAGKRPLHDLLLHLNIHLHS